MFSYFAKILKSSEYQSVLKVYYLTKNRKKWAKSLNIRKLQTTNYQYNIFFLFLLFLRYCTGSGYYKSLVSQKLTRDFAFLTYTKSLLYNNLTSNNCKKVEHRLIPQTLLNAIYFYRF